VFVNPNKMTDMEAEKTAHDIALKLEPELKYPRRNPRHADPRKRVIEYAR